MEPGPQRRLLRRQPDSVCTCRSSRDSGAPPLRRQRRGTAEQPVVPVVVDAAPYRCGPTLSVALARRHRVPLSREPQRVVASSARSVRTGRGRSRTFRGAHSSSGSNFPVGRPDPPSSSSVRQSSRGSDSCRTSSRSDRTDLLVPVEGRRAGKIRDVARAHAPVGVIRTRCWTSRRRARSSDSLPRFLLRQRWFGAERQANLDGRTGTHPRAEHRARRIVRPGRTRRRDLHRGRAGHVRAPARRQARERGHRPRVRSGEGRDSRGTWMVVDGLRDAALAGALLEDDRAGDGWRAASAAAWSGHGPRGSHASAAKAAEPQFGWGDQSNTSVTFGDELVLKVFRRLEEGINPELEVGRFVTDHTVFRHSAPTAGAIELPDGRGGSTVAGLPGLRAERGGRVGLRARRRPGVVRASVGAAGRPIDPARRAVGDESMVGELPSLLTYDLIGPFLGRLPAWLLGRRTAQLHLALGSVPTTRCSGPSRSLACTSDRCIRRCDRRR